MEVVDQERQEIILTPNDQLVEILDLMENPQAGKYSEKMQSRFIMIFLQSQIVNLTFPVAICKKRC